MKIKNTLFLLMCLLLISSCGPLASKDPLNGTLWQLETMGGLEPVAGSSITLEFADQRLSGSAGCNSYGAGYEIDGDKLQFDSVAMTEMACLDDNIMQEESKFTELLGQVVQFKITEGELELVDGSGNAVLIFIPR